MEKLTCINCKKGFNSWRREIECGNCEDGFEEVSPGHSWFIGDYRRCTVCYGKTNFTIMERSLCSEACVDEYFDNENN